jgi:hypothetical protein
MSADLDHCSPNNARSACIGVGLPEPTIGSAAPYEDFWEFLRTLHILPYDLGTATAQTEALVKSMLAATAIGHDKLAVATASWNSLVKLAVESMGIARSFRREELPEELRASHLALGPAQHEALAILASHGLTVLNGIKDTIAQTVRLSRTKVESRVSEALVGNQVVIIAGPAGVGKSAVAKRVVENLASDHFVFAFRAEEFAEPHLDTTLQKAGITVPAEVLRGLLSGQSRKLLLVESVERLLEHSTREAFNDLLSLLSADESITLVLTCRSYSLEIVRSSLIAPLGIPAAVAIVPELDEAEIDAVENELPALKRPAGSPVLRKLFRNPYVLDKAAVMAWPEGGTLPDDERSFRTKFWSEVVRKDAEAAGGMPGRRERTFREVALRRARALTPYAACDDLDPAVIEQLRRDDLIAHPNTTLGLAAAAHDVLEDWALVHWIDDKFQLAQGDCNQFLAALDESPAIRRTYRRWLQELLELAPEGADPFVQHVLTSQAVSAHLRDDTCVATLLAASSAEFLARNDTLLLAGDCRLLVRMIHLLRIACVKTPEWLKASGQPSYFVPDGVAWRAMLKVVRTHLDRLLPASRLLELGLIEDFAKSIAWWDPYPPGSVDAAFISHSLLPHFDDYDSDKQKKSTLEVIAKIPRAAPNEFLRLVEMAKHPEADRQTAEDFVEIVLEGTNSLPAARDFPDEVIDLAESRFLLTEAELRSGTASHDTLGVDTSFGISYKLHSDFFPARPTVGFLHHYFDCVRRRE